ncbi:MAG: prolyl oligopeptidase family serine peptidase [Bacteroidales bacterium]
MSRRTFYLLVSLLLLFIPTGAQTEFIFRQGLAIGNVHQYGRQAMFTDQFAWRYLAPGYQSPEAGLVLFTEPKGQEVKWKEIKADSSGRFTGRDGSNGYLYLTYRSPKEQGAIINMTGNTMFYLNSEAHAGDPYELGWMYVPVRLKKGLNEIYVRTGFLGRQGVKARIIFPDTPVTVNTEDATLPHIVPGHNNENLLGAVVILNTTAQPLTGLKLRSELKGKELTVDVPAILPYSSRKVAFRFNGSGVTEKGSASASLTLESKGKVLARSIVKVEAIAAGEPYSCTFVSDIDGSVQYYAVNPQSGSGNQPPALFLSVHGAGVEAIGQARAYRPKDWGVLVAPTNRRGRGFNWEDWGRIDALEVLDLAVKQFNPDPAGIFLTGHSMGGHGTWYLGATFPGKWAAIAPCSGYPTLMAYGSADGKIPQPGDNINEKNLARASNGSDVNELANNYGSAGVYVLHGDNDRTVSVDYARQMRAVLAKFHPDFSYYEYPGGSHWWSNESVDWPPLFDYFRWHKINPDSVINKIDFTTANPAVSPAYYWASVIQQQEPLKYSRLKINRDKQKGMVSGTTVNVSVLKLDVSGLNGDNLTIQLDGNEIKTPKPVSGTFIYLTRNPDWALGTAPDATDKGIMRNGTFKEPFNHRMVFVYGTTGTKQENDWSLAKAKFDAEAWYYRGNGAVDIVADKNFTPAGYPDRGVIIYGNATTNSAWPILLSGCPVQVKRGSISFGKETIEGDNYGAYLMYPRPDSKTASVAAVTGTGLTGMHAADANQYFSGGSGFPDYMIFTADLARDGVKAVKYSGFYGNRWELDTNKKR